METVRGFGKPVGPEYGAQDAQLVSHIRGDEDRLYHHGSS
jgi:hypothetical protein